MNGPSQRTMHGGSVSRVGKHFLQSHKQRRLWGRGGRTLSKRQRRPMRQTRTEILHRFSSQPKNTHLSKLTHAYTQVPQSPSSIKRASLPPFPSISHYNLESYKASPLQHALTPPPAPDRSGIEPFPSVESSIESTQSSSGHNFHMPSSGLSSSDTTSPTFLNSQPVQIYCAGCRRLSVLRESYACTECISGFCSDCVYALNSEQQRGGGGRGRVCPRCGVDGGSYKAFQLDLR